MLQRLLAKALYDNVAESPDELDFKRGDVLTVLEQETSGLEGWWLCSLRGKQGIAPGNRLKMVTGLVANHMRSHTSDFQSLDKTQQEWNRRSWDGSNHKVVTPIHQGDMYTYDHPKGAQQQDYDVPPTRYHGSAHSSREDLLNGSSSSFEQSFYDTPPQSRSFRSADNSVYETPPSQLGIDGYDTPGGSVRTSLASKFSDETMSMSSGISSYNKSNPPSMCDSARSSMDISPMDLYDVPPSQREREARDREAKMASYPIRSSKDSGLDMYDSPPKIKSGASLNEDYDVPKGSAADGTEIHFKNVHFPHSEPTSPGGFREDYDVPKSSPFAQKHTSNVNNLSVASNTSDMEDYDVPKQPTPVMGKPPIAAKSKRHKSNSIGSLLDDYDTPQTHISKKVTKDDSYAKSGTKKLFDPEVSDEENNYDEPDQSDSVKQAQMFGAKPKLHKQEHAIDDIYDSPRSNAPVKNMTKEFSALSVSSKKPEVLGVYDIPPQVTRDSVISARSDSSDEKDDGSYRLSTCSSSDSHCSEPIIYDELPLDLDAANDLIIKLQQDVQKSVNSFQSSTHSSWRKKENIDQRLYEIKMSCSKVEQALGEFVEFGQGTLANSAKLSDRKLISKLSKYLIPLQQALQQMRVCIKHLDDANWQIAKMSSDSNKKDDLGIFASQTKDIISDVKKLTSFIQGNSSLLFKRAKDFKRSARSTEHSTLLGPGKTPAGKKPALPAKTLNLSTTVQARPLPAPPPTERPLPPTPTDKKGPQFGFTTGDVGSKRNSGEFKHWSGEIQVKRLSTDSLDRASFKSDDLMQDYDYVELEEEEKAKQNKQEKTIPEENHVNVVNNKEKQECDRDSYASDMEKTLDEVNDVNIYSDDSGGTLKRETKLSTETVGDTESECDTGTLKRKPHIEDSAEYDSGTLKHNNNNTNEEPVRDTGDFVRTPVNKDSEMTVMPCLEPESKNGGGLLAEDKQVLAFYSEQLETHTALLTNSIQAFFQCIENNEAPKVFISHSKFVVLSAHKLVYIGDTLHRNVKHDQIRNLIIQRANYLCDCLKQTVNSTKTAALQYPSVPAVQDMVDRVLAVSHAARDLRHLVTDVSNS
ncbi:breast cancer anti-estrogen resistance protein 1-like isoform X3 [Dreissena polymorpha]|uniref:breast cancer anti-estrogen resistance protein 1-like isoform X3 n=1 Tax=Dreissena polymorpha TaxID=45954 RepID=UPI002264E8D6|nr:breast cancer anti-estrogen resistance protein 1-like isoform X3 [Dreissena polymorpha]